MLRARAVAELADALDAELAPARRHPRCSPSSSCRCSRVLADLEAAGIAVDGERLADAGGRLRRRRSSRPPRTRTRDRQGDQPRLAEAAAGGAVRRARACPRPSAPRPATPPTPTRCRRCSSQTEHPFLEHLLVHRDATRLQDHRRRAAQVDRRRRTHPHHLQPDHRGHRPAVAPPTRTCRTSRSARPTGAGSARRSSSVDGFDELMTADYSQIEMRIMAHLSGDEALIEAFRSRSRLPRRHRGAGVRGRRGRGRRRSSAPRSRR